jgi:hypothetical protein
LQPGLVVAVQAAREFGERDPNTIMDRKVGRDLVTLYAAADWSRVIFSNLAGGSNAVELCPKS